MPMDFQHFKIEAKIGSGGMGEVYQARDQKLGRQVALKILPKALGDDAVRRARFLQEAKTASALTHPNVCVIYEIGESSDHQPYIAMEMIEGQPLDQMIQGGPLTIDAVVDFSIQISDALAAAYEVNIIHRDIKSSNIMINVRQQAKVLDFGLAKRLHEINEDGGDELAKTREGQILGTPNYMSPEQALGKGLDHRSDLFSFGVVMYEMATGQRPFVADRLGEIMDQIIHATPRAPTRHNSEIPVELERIIMRCLRKSPDERFQSAEDLRLALTALKTEGSLPQPVENLDSTRPLMSVPQATPASPSRLSAECIKDSDVLISCAELDDQPLTPDGEGWVDRLQRNLRIKIEQLTGEPLKVATAALPPGKTEVDETIYDSMATAQTLISIISPPFVKSKSCSDSVDHYCRVSAPSPPTTDRFASKMFKVFKTPVNQDDMSPTMSGALEQLPGFEFFDICPETGRIREYNDAFRDDISQRYYERVYDLAYEVCQGLQRQEPSPQPTELLDSSAALPFRKTVFLAETTSDLREERDRLRRELIEQGHRVLPDRVLPQVAAELEENLRFYLEQCNFSIHLIGDRYGLVPEDASTSSIVIQNQLAAQESSTRELPRIIWMPRNVNPTDDRQAAFIDSLVQDPNAQLGADVIRDTLENLKQLLNERWHKEAERRSNQRAVADSQVLDEVTRLYLIHDIEDEQSVEAIEDFFYDRGIEVMLPEFEGTESEVSAIHIQSLQDCDAVMIYYGTCAKSWVDIKLRELTKALGYRDGQPIDLRVVYIAPSDDRRKTRFKSLSAEIIRQTDDNLDVASLENIATRIKALKQPTSKSE